MSTRTKEVSVLNGLTLTAIEVAEDKESILFTTDSGRLFRMYHWQDCCEQVVLEDIIGSLEDLIGSPLLLAEENSASFDVDHDSCTWTFYLFATTKGYVTLRWNGTSNGYYSKIVDFVEVFNP